MKQMNYLYHLDVVDELKRELALARASSDYWRAKYIAARKVNVFAGAISAYSNVKMDNTNALYWFEHAQRSPLDECDE